MSYDLAVWEGDRPANDATATAEFQSLYERYVEPGEPVEPTKRIAAYVAALQDRDPDIDADASGPLVYFAISWSRADEVAEWAAGLAGDHGLNCYDPQKDQLRTPPGRPWRFELTSERGRPVRDPGPEDVRKAVTRLSANNYFAVLTRADEWYIQVGYGEQAGTRPGWYALERRDGSPDQHYRAVVTSIEDVVRAFVGFLHDDPTVPLRFPWQAHVV